MNASVEEWPAKKASPEYEEALVSEVSNAHACGMSVIYLFDKGVSRPPDFIDWIDGMDFCRLSSSFGMPSLRFSMNIAARQREMVALAMAALGQDDIKVKGQVWIMGSCFVNDEPVLMPVVKPIV
jgi:hypothetical protein